MLFFPSPVPYVATGSLVTGQSMHHPKPIRAWPPPYSLPRLCCPPSSHR